MVRDMSLWLEPPTDSMQEMLSMLPSLTTLLMTGVTKCYCARHPFIPFCLGTLGIGAVAKVVLRALDARAHQIFGRVPHLKILVLRSLPPGTLNGTPAFAGVHYYVAREGKCEDGRKYRFGVWTPQDKMKGNLNGHSILRFPEERIGPMWV